MKFRVNVPVLRFIRIVGEFGNRERSMSQCGGKFLPSKCGKYATMDGNGENPSNKEN